MGLLLGSLPHSCRSFNLWLLDLEINDRYYYIMALVLDSSTFTDKDAYERLKCPRCKLLLNDPVQPSCGHRLCRTCADEIINTGPSPPSCPLEDCQEEFELEDGEPVRALVVPTPDHLSIAMGCDQITDRV